MYIYVYLYMYMYILILRTVCTVYMYIEKMCIAHYSIRERKGNSESTHTCTFTNKMKKR